MSMAEMEHDHVKARLPAPFRRVRKGADDPLHLLMGELRREPLIPQIQLDGGHRAPAVDGVRYIHQAMDHKSVRQIDRIMVRIRIGLGHRAVPHRDDARAEFGELGGIVHEFRGGQPIPGTKHGLRRGNLNAVSDPKRTDLDRLEYCFQTCHLHLSPIS